MWKNSFCAYYTIFVIKSKKAIAEAFCYTSFMNIVFFDTETTGVDERDRLCQIAWMQDGALQAGFFKPPFPIPPEASAVHHITNAMVEDRPAFIESEEYSAIKELFEADNTIVVAHNAKFDLAMLKKEGVEPKQHICTLKVARAMDPEGKIQKYSLQFLRYALNLEIDENALAHSADGDVLVMEKLFARLLKKLMEKMTREEALKEMSDISTLPTLFKTIPFGKHRGKEISALAKEERNYLEWLLAEKEKKPMGEEDWIYTIKFHLGKLV